MRIISTTNFEAGEITHRPDANNKFSAVATATASINEDNVGSEGIDKRQIAAHAYPGGRLEPIVYADYTTNCASTITNGTYNPQDGTDAFYISHGDGLHLNWSALSGGGVVVKDGDLVRIHFDISLQLINDAGYANEGPQGPDSGSRVNNAPDAIGILFFPLWRINGGAFTQLANEADLDASLTAPANILFNNTDKKVDSVAFCSMEGYLSGTDCVANRSVHGTWNYIHSGADITINEIKLYARGPMVYQWETGGGGSRVFHAPVWGTGRYAGNYLAIPASGATNFSIVLNSGHLGAVIMRGES